MFMLQFKIRNSTYYCIKQFNLINSRSFRNLSVMQKTKLTLYGDEASPPVRFVMMTASILDVKLDFHEIDLFKGENKTEFYKKINPLQKVPALQVDDTVIVDSHAIALYLCRTSGQHDLYPKDALHKAKVDQMLLFNACILFPIDSAVMTDYFAGKWPAEQKYVEQWYKALDMLELLLTKNQWLSGDKMSLSDICCAATMSSLQLLIPSLDKYKHIKKWFNKLQELPCFEINTQGLKRLDAFVKKFSST